MAKKVICPYCNTQFDREKIQCIKVGRRYAHEDCFKNAEKNKSQEQKDKEQLDAFILDLFQVNFVPPKIQKQIKQYKEENNYTYSGILKTLIYWYKIKKQSIDKANGGIGIVPYQYNNALMYYRAIWEAQQKNEIKLQTYDAPEVMEVTILPPQLKVRKRKLFSFLDEEE